jgi:hypothetical protein
LKKLKKIIAIPFLVLAAVLALPAISIPLAHAATGTVCITPGTVTTCPTPPVVITGANGANIVVNVNIAGSDAFLGADVAVNTHSLNGLSVDLTSSLLTTCAGCGPFITSICINNTPVGFGSSCSPGIDGPGVVHVTKVDLGAGVPAGAVGNLFKITYNVLSQTQDTIGFVSNPTQCALSSSPPFCVTVALSASASPEMLQTAFFPMIPPGFTYTLAATSATDLRLPGVTSMTTSIVTATLATGTSQAVALTGAAPSGSGITIGFSPNPVTPTLTSTATVTVPASTLDGSYIITVTGTLVTQTIPPTADVSTTFTLTVLTVQPALVHGKLSWTHHLSLTKNTLGQDWTAVVNNPLSTPIFYLIHIQGTSIAGTMNSFDVMCGSNGCFGTGSSTGTPTPIQLAAGALVKGPDFHQMIPSGFTNDKFGFTATLVWGTSASSVTTLSNQKSGAFAVVP